MCGIAGIVRFDGGARLQVERARAMRRGLRHRGPDGEGEVVLDEAVLEFTRLSLLDRVGGVQPMCTPDGRYTIVYNGEVYDHEELRARLRYPFRTRSDTETVLAAFAAWGPGCVELLNGMFAFFVWDAKMRRGFAARDRLGVKPLAYAWDGREFVFGSEASVVARALGPMAVNTEAVLEYLVAPCFSGVARPMFLNVEYLQPGHWLELGPEGATVRRYYRFAPATQGEGASEEQLGGAFQRAVERACVADEQVGVFLSGGLDSTAVAAVAARRRPELKAYSIVFEGMDEFDYARSAIVVGNDMDFIEVARRAMAVDWRAVVVPRTELAADLERVARTNDALPAWEQEVAQDRLARAARVDEIKAVLVGDAADETHYGYHFLLDAATTASARAMIEKFAGVPVRRAVAEDPIGVFADRYREWMRGEVEDGDARISGATRLIVERWLPRLLHNGDIHGMRSGVEARVPFADIELLALAATVPPRAGLADGEKTRLRGALRGAVPEEIRTRRKSALPKDQRAGAVYQRELVKLLPEAPSVVRELVDLDALRPLLDPRRELGEWERAGLFRVLGLCHFSRHHGIP